MENDIHKRQDASRPVEHRLGERAGPAPSVSEASLGNEAWVLQNCIDLTATAQCLRWGGRVALRDSPEPGKKEGGGVGEAVGDNPGSVWQCNGRSRLNNKWSPAHWVKAVSIRGVSVSARPPMSLIVKSLNLKICMEGPVLIRKNRQPEPDPPKISL
jgi:hypothetical protein